MSDYCADKEQAEQEYVDPAPLDLEERLSDLDRFVENWNALPAVVCQRALQAMHGLLVYAACCGAGDSVVRRYVFDDGDPRKREWR